MKKRLLALSLCLVLATSLLPITAAAENTVNYVDIKAYGLYKDNVHYGYYRLKNPSFYVKYDGDTGGGAIDSSDPKYYADSTLYTDSGCSNYLTDQPKDGTTYYASCRIQTRGPQDPLPVLNTSSIRDQIVKLDISGYKADFIRAGSNPHAFVVEISLAKDHKWQFTVSESGDKLTAECQNEGCGEKVSVSLKADSVTLPTSPFNAQLEGREQFKAAFPNAVIGDLVYKYHGPNGWSVVEPTAANAKAGEYQVGVRITIPSNNAGDNVGGQNQDQVYDLYVKYTAADPAITAQTGDSRPIELMMASVLVFSALAAAAFILDNKRRKASL